MFILPGHERAIEPVPEGDKIVKRTAACVIGAVDRRLDQVTMTVPARVVAFAVEGDVRGLGEGRCVQAMGGAERSLHPEEIVSARPVLREKIFPFVQADAVNRKLRGHPGMEILRQAFGRLREIR